MKSLIWKEFRLCWPILLVGVVLLVAPYTIQVLYLFLEEFRSGRETVQAAVASLGTSVLTLTLLGAYAIAGERADRSAEFLAYQPIARRKIVASKLVWPTVVAAVAWSVNLGVMFAYGEFVGNRREAALAGLAVLLAMDLGCFSVAWFVSSLQDSPTYAVAGAVVTPVAIGLCFSALNWLTDNRMYETLSQRGSLAAYVAAILAVAAASFVGGCWYYLQRVEP
ncbi:MAG: ABC transporter permease subunit [Pirellulaceae bacterium]